MIGAIKTRGVALIEVLIAMAVLGTAGLAVTGVVREAILAQAETNRVETAVRNADRVLTAVSLLKRDELDQAIGRMSIGEFDVSVQRPETGLYRLSIAEHSAPDYSLLVTVVQRPPEARQ